MRKIFITNSIIDLSKEYANGLFLNRQTNFDRPISNLQNLESSLRSRRRYIVYADYVRNIIDKYNIIIRIRPEYFDSLHSRYFNALTKHQLKHSIQYKGKKKSFYKLVVDAMRYDAVRDQEFLSYVKRLEIRTCIYCNAQFAITTGNKKNALCGRYELDHFYPKSTYPFLCTSFFNLQPSCASCNKSKSDNKALFSLYTKNPNDLSPFIFVLDKKSIVRYMLTQNCEDLKLSFNSSHVSYNPLTDDHEDKFHITELYNTQKDIVEEIIWKAKIYNKSYQESLRDSFSRLFHGNDNFNRFIISNYDQAKDIHKRPMAKMIQDIAKQLGLI